MSGTQAPLEHFQVFVLAGKAPEFPALGAPYTQLGSTTHFTAYYEDTLGANGQIFADVVLDFCEDDYSASQGYYGNISIPELPFLVYIDSGAFAYHAGCLSLKKGNSRIANHCRRSWGESPLSNNVDSCFQTDNAEGKRCRTQFWSRF